MKNICCLRKDIILAEKYLYSLKTRGCALRDDCRLRGGCKGVDAARASLPAELWFRSTQAPTAALAPLLSACAEPGAAARATVPRGPGTKVAVVIAGGGAGALAGSYLPAHQLGLAAGPAAGCHRARHARASARPQSKSRAWCLWPASFVSNSRPPPPATASSQRHGMLVKPRTRRRPSTECQTALAEAEQGLATLTQQGCRWGISHLT